MFFSSKYTQPWPKTWGERLPSCPSEGTLPGEPGLKYIGSCLLQALVSHHWGKPLRGNKNNNNNNNNKKQRILLCYSWHSHHIDCKASCQYPSNDKINPGCVLAMGQMPAEGYNECMKHTQARSQRATKWQVWKYPISDTIFWVREGGKWASSKLTETST